MDISILITILVAFVITAILGPVFIPVLKKIKAGQSIREDGPQAHLSKAGTPTMGGLMIILAVIITCISMTVRKGLNADMGILLVSFVLCGLIGFCDDFVKVVKKRNLGLTALQKLIFQIIIAVVIAVYQAKVSVYGTSIYIPILRDYADLGWFYIPFVAFVLVAMVNAVNLTDGLDGLAGGSVAIVALFLALTGADIGYTSSSIFCAAVAGACFGFLLFNRHPAKVFMGDTGSLALGGSAGGGGGDDEHRADPSDRGGHLRGGGAVRHDPGGQLQDAGQARVPDGSSSPSFRAGRMEGDEGGGRVLGDHAFTLHIIDIFVVK